MELFFSTEIFDNHLYLSLEESRHCLTVLRKVDGDIINAIDGKGNFFEGLLKIEGKNKPVKVDLRSKTHFETSAHQWAFHLAIAPTKNSDRMEWLIEKTVELGVASITFLKCEHNERSNLRMDRLEKIAISALKQSKQYWLPTLKPLQSFTSFIEGLNTMDNCFIAHCQNDHKTSFEAVNLNSSCTMLIGPEGDFSPTEIILATEKGFKPVSLGKSRLRTETAALYACGIYRSKFSMAGNG